MVLEGIPMLMATFIQESLNKAKNMGKATLSGPAATSIMVNIPTITFQNAVLSRGLLEKNM